MWENVKLALCFVGVAVVYFAACSAIGAYLSWRQKAPK